MARESRSVTVSMTFCLLVSKGLNVGLIIQKVPGNRIAHVCACAHPTPLEPGSLNSLLESSPVQHDLQLYTLWEIAIKI